MNGILKVDSSVLAAKSGEFDSVRSQIMTLIEDMKSKVSALSGVWEGESAQHFQSKFATLNDDIDYLNRIIMEHVTDLSELSGVYQKVEEVDVSQYIEPLPEDIIKY